MRIAFIEPSIAHIEPLGIGYLAARLCQDGHEVRYFEAPRSRLLGRLKKFSPHILAYSITTGRHALCKELNHILREKGGIPALSLFVGPHCTFFPEFIESDE